MPRNEFEDYISPIYIDDDDTLRFSFNGQPTGLKAQRDENGNIAYERYETTSGESYRMLKVKEIAVPWYVRVWRWLKGRS